MPNPPTPADRLAAVNNTNISIRQLFDDVIQECWRVAFRNGYYHGEDAANFERPEVDDLRAASMESYTYYCDSEDAVDVEDGPLNAALTALLAADPPGATLLALAREADEWLDTPTVYTPSADFHRLRDDATHTARLLRAITNAITARAASPSPVPESATLADDLEKLSMTLPPVCDRERDAIKALAKRMRAASPSPGAVEADLIEYAWGIICNAGGGDWTRESADWQTAAARFREQYHAWLASAARRGAAGGQDG